ncbi:hypothetical protein GJAV_G00057250 [Gymnothorax javanicus]|nr:hypothetical protein GJAV_G00057250 [Gymnothorax javanicus]
MWRSIWRRSACGSTEGNSPVIKKQSNSRKGWKMERPLHRERRQPAAQSTCRNGGRVDCHSQRIISTQVQGGWATTVASHCQNTQRCSTFAQI